MGRTCGDASFRVETLTNIPWNLYKTLSYPLQYIGVG